MAIVQAEESRAYFQGLCESVGPEKTKEWTELEERMQIERDVNISIMDQLDVAERQGSYYKYIRYFRP